MGTEARCRAVTRTLTDLSLRACGGQRVQVGCQESARKVTTQLGIFDKVSSGLESGADAHYDNLESLRVTVHPILNPLINLSGGGSLSSKAQQPRIRMDENLGGLFSFHYTSCTSMLEPPRISRERENGNRLCPGRGMDTQILRVRATPWRM